MAAFGTRLPEVAAFADLLAGDGVAHGLIGPREVGRLWERHLLPGAVPAVLIPRAATVCDVGSGAGLPGLLIALARPDLRVTLLEPMERRCRFLGRAVALTGLTGRVEVRRARAEELASVVPGFDAVLARAVARLPRLLELLLPLGRPGGQLIAIKGSAVQAELDEASAVLAGPRVSRWDLLELAVPGLPAAVGDPPLIRVVRVVPADTVTASTTSRPPPVRRR